MKSGKKKRNDDSFRMSLSDVIQIIYRKSCPYKSYIVNDLL